MLLTSEPSLQSLHLLAFDLLNVFKYILCVFLLKLLFFLCLWYVHGHQEGGCGQEDLKGPELVVRDRIVMERRNIIPVRLGSVVNKTGLLLSRASSAVACSPPMPP